MAAGILVLAFTGTCLVLAGIELSLVPFYVIVAVFLGVAILRGRNRPHMRRGRSGQSHALGAWTGLHLLTAVLLSTAALVLVGLGIAGSHDRLWWDGWAIWGLKAKVLLAEGGLPPAFRDPGGPYAFSHLDYPLGLPLVGWWLYAHAGEVEPALLSAAGVVWLALIVAWVWGALRDRVPSWAAAAAALGAAAFWPLGFYAIGGTADVLVALALAGAVGTLARGVGDGEPPIPGNASRWLQGAGAVALFLAMGAVVKNEGLALLILGTALLGWLVWRGRARGASPWPIVISIAAVVPWVLFRATAGLSTDVLALPTLASLSARAPMLARGLGIQLAAPEWVPVPLMALVGLWAMARGRRDGGAGRDGLPATQHRQDGRALPLGGLPAAWALLGAYFLTTCAVYLSSEQDLTWLLLTSLPRVLGAMVPATVLLSVLSMFAERTA